MSMSSRSPRSVPAAVSDSSSDASAGTVRPPVPREVWVLLVAAFCVAIGFGLVAPVLPAYAQSFHVSTEAAAAIVSVFAGMRLVFAPAGGALISRLGERWVYVGGLLIVALSTGACAFADQYWQLLLYRGLGGIGSTMFTVSAVALLVRVSPPLIRGRTSSLYGAGFLLGNMLGPAAGSLTSTLGYRAPFLIYAGTLTVAAVVVTIFLSGASLRPAPGTPASVPMTVGEAWRDTSYRALLVSGFCNGWANFGVRIALLPLFAVTVPGLGLQWAGIALTVFAVGNALALTFSGRVVDVHGRKPLILLGVLVNGLGTASIGFTHAVPALLVVSLVAGLGAGAMGPAMQAAVADVVGNDRGGGKVVATFQMATDAGTIIGPVLAGWMASRFGFGWAFCSVFVLMIASIVAWLPAPETLPTFSRRAPGDDGAAHSPVTAAEEDVERHDS